MAQHKKIPERELAEKIIHLHDDLGLGFRKIAKESSSQGYRMSKDTAHRLYHKYKKGDDVAAEEDEELRQLKETEEEARGHLKLEREKQEVRKRLIDLFVEEKTATFDQRKKLFTDQNKLLNFARKALPIIDPMLWDEFQEFCAEHNYDLANALTIALGEQKYYETQQHTDERQRVDFYLISGIKECLNSWRADDQKESECKEKLESEPTNEEENGKEWEVVEIPVYDSSFEYDEDWVTVTIEQDEPEETEIYTDSDS